MGLRLATANGAIASQTTDIAGMPTAALFDPATASLVEYALPHSATLNPAGYIYQTMGLWLYIDPMTGAMSENYFSAGAPTPITMFPATGTAKYTGQTTGSFVDAITHDPAYVVATMTATADFGAASVAFSTSGTVMLSANAPANALPIANPGLDMTGILSYATGNNVFAGSNTFTGTTTTANGMSGNATGRFYGPTITTTAPGIVTSGMPPEIGGTFALMGNNIGVMQGAFGGSVVPMTTLPSITGNVTPKAVTWPTLLPHSLYPQAPGVFQTAGSYDAITQTADYTFDPFAAAAATPTRKVTTLNIQQVYPQNSSGIQITQGAPYPADPTLSQPSMMTNSNGRLLSNANSSWTISTANGAVASLTTDIAGLPTATLSDSATGGISEYVLPYSATMNPAGYTYQTIGKWIYVDTYATVENYGSSE